MVDTSMSTGSVVNFFNMDASGYATRSNSTAGAPAFGAAASYNVISATAFSYVLSVIICCNRVVFEPMVVGRNAARGLRVLQVQKMPTRQLMVRLE